MDTLAFVHLFVYPMALGIILTLLIVLTQHCRTKWHFALGVVLFWVVLGVALLAIETHMNYQGYMV